jgi:hypothetical protein
MGVIFSYQVSPDSNVFYYANSSAGECPNLYSPASVNATTFEAGTWTQKVLVETRWANGQLEWRVKMNGQPQVNPSQSLTPSFRTAYDNVKDGAAPAIDQAFAASIETEIAQIANNQSAAIKVGISKYFDQGMATVDKDVAAQIVNIMQVKRSNTATPIYPNAWPKSWQQLAQYQVHGKIKIIPSVICSSQEDHPFKLCLTDGELKSCDPGAVRIVTDNAMILITVNSSAPIVIHDYTDTTELFSNTYSAGSAIMTKVYNDLKKRDDKRTECLMALNQPELSASEVMRLQQELFLAMQPMRESRSEGHLAYGLSSSGPGVVGINFSVPIGDGGILWHQRRITFYLNPNNFAAEINYWQQYFARVREWQQQVRTFNQAAANQVITEIAVPPTDLQLPPGSEPAPNPGFILLPDLLQPPANGAGSGSGLLLPDLDWGYLELIDGGTIIFGPIP